MKIFKIFRKILALGIVILVFVYHKDISNYIISNYIYNKNSTISITKNEYSKSIDYSFVKITDDFLAKDYQQLLDIFYTILDSGENSFYFYCDDSYNNCIGDVNNLLPYNDGQSVLSEINNFVHPYNSYKSITVTTNNFGKISVQIDKQYSKEKINYINQELEKIKTNIINNDMDNRKMILAFHDYVINNTQYDIDRAENMDDTKYKNSTTHTAYGLLENKKALCGGYSDLMSIFLSQLDINNIRISAHNHVWNLVFIDEWLHLDMTWDDPVTNTGEPFLIHDYFLITSKNLKKADDVEHDFNPKIFAEAN
jgi:Uncharacterized protein involved in cytokinesis, contains TGc (transglutaminase/protease-like) domain